MSKFVSLLFFCQILGACIGACLAVWSQYAYIRAVRDGKINIAERAHLDVLARGLRFGMTLILISSLALVVIAYVGHTALQPASTAGYWVFMMLAFLIIGITWALSCRQVSFEIGSAVALSAWWLLAFITFGWLSASFGSAVALYVVLTVIVYALIRLVHFFALHKN